MSAPDVAVSLAAAYFLVFGTALVVRPALAEGFGLRWVNDAGRAEVRCYYGAVSWALAAFLVYLQRQDLTLAALTGVSFLAVAVCSMRLITTAVDGSWRDPYNRVAVPAELAFVVGLLAVRLTA